MKMKRIALFLTALFLAGVLPAWGQPPSPTEQLKGTVNEIMTILADDAMPSQARDQRLEKLVKDRFEFQIMSQMVLGPSWRRASAQERERFVDLFTSLLEANYRGRLSDYADQYTDEQVHFVGERIKEDRAQVDTLVVTKEGRFPISYRVVLQGGEWKVYDVVIEEVSLVRTYRTTYDEVVRKEGFEGLFARMEERVRRLEIAPEEAVSP